MFTAGTGQTWTGGSCLGGDGSPRKAQSPQPCRQTVSLCDRCVTSRNLGAKREGQESQEVGIRELPGPPVPYLEQTTTSLPRTSNTQESPCSGSFLSIVALGLLRLTPLLTFTPSWHFLSVSRHSPASDHLTTGCSTGGKKNSNRYCQKELGENKNKKSDKFPNKHSGMR